MPFSTIFTRIIQREIPAYIVAEDAAHIAFLDIAPLVKGHVLVVPKRVVDNFFNLPDKELAALMIFAKKVAHAITRVVDCLRVGVKVHGLEVPHAHVHLIPILHAADFATLGNDAPKLSKKEMELLSQHIKKAMVEAGTDALVADL